MRNRQWKSLLDQVVQVAKQEASNTSVLSQEVLGSANPCRNFQSHASQSKKNFLNSNCFRSNESGKGFLGKRFQSTSTSSQTSKNTVGEIQKSLARTAVNTKGRASSMRVSVYNSLPNQVKQILHNAQQPGNLQRVLKLQLEAFWQRYSRVILVAGAIFLVYALWRTLFYFASVFFKFSASMADLGFLALAAALASFGFLYLRRLYTINPASVYRKAMYQLNTNPGILEIMGAPVAGSSVRVTALRGGGLSLKGLLPKYRSRKVLMMFPLTGSERRGLVSLEAKKQRGRYLFKLLAVDAPAPDGKDQRIFLEGDQKVYDKGGILAELRDPFLLVLKMKEMDEVEDDLDDAADDAAVAQRKREKQAAKLKASPKSMDEGGGMYFYERVYWGLRNAVSRGSQSEASKTEIPAAKPIGKEDTLLKIQKSAENINTASNPKPPIDTEADRIHQYKKEASVQQAP